MDDEPRQEAYEIHIGNGSLYLIVSETVRTRIEGRTIWGDHCLVGFKIAHLNEDKNIIEGKAVEFDGPSVNAIADGLSSIIHIAIDRNNTVAMGGRPGIEAVTQDDGTIRIVKDNTSIDVPREDAFDLAGWLGAIGRQIRTFTR